MVKNSETSLSPWAERRRLYVAAMLRCIGWCFRDRRTGRIVVAQWPNLALWLFGAFRLAAALAPLPPARWASIAAEIALAIWAADELARGVNPWRRALGTAVLAWMAYGWVSGRA